MSPPVRLLKTVRLLETLEYRVEVWSKINKAYTVRRTGTLIRETRVGCLTLLESILIFSYLLN